MSNPQTDRGSFASLFEEMPDIRPFPQVASRVLAACDDPSATPEQICELVQCDPAIAIRVMKVANSPAYGCSGDVRSLRHALVILGFRTLKNIVISIAAGDVFTGDKQTAHSFQKLWNHSLGCAAVAQRIATETGLAAADEAMLAGIVHDAGKIVFLDVAHDEYTGAMEGVTAGITEREHELFGIDHQELGLRCADEWGLPFEIGDAIGMHHEAFSENDNPELANLVGLAERLALFWGVGSEPADNGTLQEIAESCVLPIDVEVLDALEAVVRADFQSLTEAFSN